MAPSLAGISHIQVRLLTQIRDAYFWLLDIFTWCQLSTSKLTWAAQVFTSKLSPPLSLLMIIAGFQWLRLKTLEISLTPDFQILYIQTVNKSQRSVFTLYFKPGLVPLSCYHHLSITQPPLSWHIPAELSVCSQGSTIFFWSCEKLKVRSLTLSFRILNGYPALLGQKPKSWGWPWNSGRPHHPFFTSNTPHMFMFKTFAHCFSFNIFRHTLHHFFLGIYIQIKL